jgi:hypothetical protein
MTPVEAAKALGIRPQVVYGFIKHHRVKVFNNPGGKTDHVDFKEVEALVKAVKPHRPKGSDGKPIRRAPSGVSRGTLLSAHAHLRGELKDRPHRVYAVREMPDANSEEGGLVRAYRSDGTDGPMWEVETLADAVKAGKCHIETPENLLGVLMFHWNAQGLPQLAGALQVWCEVNGVAYTEVGAK